MDSYRVVKALSAKSGVKMSEIAAACGVSLNSINRSLHGGISLDKFIKVVRACGGEVRITYQGKDIGIWR